MALDRIIFYQQPALRQPDLIAAFLGWPDAASVSTGTVSYFIDKLPAVRFAEIKSDDYYNFTLLRPSVLIESGIMRPVKTSINNFYYWLNTNGERDLILFTGIEPHLKWESYAETLVELAGYYQVHRFYFIGGLYDRIPHTRETRISGIANNPALLEVLFSNGIEPISYHGPSSIHGPLLSICELRRIPAFSLWGHVPFYIRAESNPLVCFEVIKKVAHILKINIDLEDIKKSAESLFNILNKLIDENEQMRNFLKTLEAQYDREGSSMNTEVEGADQIIKDIEDFLRKQREDG